MIDQTNTDLHLLASRAIIDYAAQVEALTAERDAARDAVINNCARVMTLTTERDALKDAAKLALDALERSHADAYLDQPAIAALKAAL